MISSAKKANRAATSCKSCGCKTRIQRVCDDRGNVKRFAICGKPNCRKMNKV